MINENEITYYTIEDKIFNHNDLYSINESNYTLTTKFPFKDFTFHIDLINTRAQNRNTLIKINSKCMSCFLTSHYNAVITTLNKTFISAKTGSHDKEELFKDIFSTLLPITTSPICKPCSFPSKQIVTNPANQIFYPCKSAYVKRVQVISHVYDSYIRSIDDTTSDIISLGISTSKPGGTYYIGLPKNISLYNRTNHNWTLLINPRSLNNNFSFTDASFLFPHYYEWIANQSVEKHIEKLPSKFQIHRCSECGLVSFGERNNHFLSWVPSVRLNAIDELENKIFLNIKDNITNPKILYFLGE